ncbi:MAG: amidohydrolase family protein [Vicinamibacterales bacterium]|nr:amidohydrolase family protein [Vicinamibacterales bacterium]
MLRSRILTGCLIATVASSLHAFAQGAGGGATLFEGARLIVGDGSAPIDNSAFLVQGDSITWVARRGERQPPAGAARVDLTGKTVMPSLIDGHNHMGLLNVRDGSDAVANYTRENLIDQLERYAYYGVSAGLSMGLEANMDLALQLRNDVLPNAARFYTVGKGIAATSMGGPTDEARLGIPWGAATDAEGRQHVRELKAKGVRFVKIWVDDREGTVPKLAPTVYRAIISEAHASGMQVLAHLSRTSALADAKDLFRAGIDGFVHTVRDADVDAEYLALVKAHPNVWTGPNIPSPGQTMDEASLLAETTPASQIEGLRKAVAARAASGNTPNALFELHCRNLKRIHDAGMVIGMGTDGTGDGFGAHEQIASYTKCGLTAAEALVAATSTNARILGMDRLGMIAAGKEASFNVLDANPLDDITNTRRLARVYLRGKEVDRQSLRAKWTK